MGIRLGATQQGRADPRSWLVASLAVTLAVTLTIRTAHARAVDFDRPVQFNIKTQPIGAALIEFSKQAHVQIVIAPEADSMMLTASIHGTVSPRAALDTILKDTGLKYAAVNDSVSVTRAVGHDTENTGMGDAQRLSAATSEHATNSPRVSSGDGTATSGAEVGRQSGPGSPEVQLAEVVVSAQKRDERAQDVPSSLQVLSGELLQDQGLVQLSDYAKEIPGLTLSAGAGPGQGAVALRGITTGTLVSSVVGIYLNDVPFTPSAGYATEHYSFDPELADVERIEVLEGPQSTLYGASSMGGIIKFVTKQPDPNHFDANFSVTGAKVDDGSSGYNIRGSANIPLVSDTLGLRASAFYRDDPGFIDNLATGQKNVNWSSVKGGSLSLLLKLNEDLQTTLSGLVQNIDTFGPNSVFLNPASLQPALGGLAYSSRINQPTTIGYRAVNDTTVWKLPLLTVTNIVSYAQLAADNYLDFSLYSAYIPGWPAGGLVNYLDTPHSRRWSDELRLASAPGKVEWLLGAFYTHETDSTGVDLRETDAAGTVVAPTSPDYNVYTYQNDQAFKEKAGFGDLTYHFTDQLDVMVGLRYTRDDLSLRINSTGLLGLINVDSPASSSAMNYLGTVTYKPQPNLTAYLRAASAYRPGGANGRTQAEIDAGVPATYAPDKLWNYEAGIKGSLYGRLLTYSVDAYHMDWKQIQLGVITGGFLATANAARAKSDGGELSLQLQPINHLDIGLKAAYSNARVTSDVPSAGFTSGDALPYSPKFTAAALADYRFAELAGMTPAVGVTFAHQGSVYTTYTGSVPTAVRYNLPSYNTLDARASLLWSNYNLSFLVDNITNKYALTDATPGYGLGAPLSGIVIRPRTFSLSLGARF